MTALTSCLLALCGTFAAQDAPDQAREDVTQRRSVDGDLMTGATVRPDQPELDETAMPAGLLKTIAPLGEASAFATGGVRLGRFEAFAGGKLLLTNGVASIEGASGGGLASWASIAGNQVAGGIGLSAHATAIELPDFGWRSYGAALGLGNRIEVSYARINFDTRDAGSTLGIGQGYTFRQDVFGAKLRLAGDLVYGPAWLPQIAIGAQYKRSHDGPVVSALGSAADSGSDVTLSATKLLLARSVLINATARYTDANQTGLLGFGSTGGAGHRLQFEGSLAYQLSRRAVIGAEYRSKPDNLGLGEDGWMDIFAAYALTPNLTLTAAYVDLGAIATFDSQRGGFVSAQVAF